MLFGSSGIPNSASPRSTEMGIAQIRKLGLDAMELAFVHSVNIRKEKTLGVNKTSKRFDVVLSCHGQYYINLNSPEPEKVEASIERVLKAARIANLCGAVSLIFHPGFYMKGDPKEVYIRIRDRLAEIVDTLESESNPIWIRPETTGKMAQFGTLDEILDLSTDIEQVLPCIDFSHIYARSLGKINTYEAFREVLEGVEASLGKEGIRNLHVHLSGIEYGKRGEIKHLNLEDSDINYSQLLAAFIEFDADGIIICESPKREEDALVLKETFKGLKNDSNN